MSSTHKVYLLSTATFLFCALSLLVNEPAANPDEAIYLSIAENLINHGRLSTSIWHHTIPGINTIAAWNPPVFFFTLAFWINLGNSTLIWQRSLSLAFAIMTVLCLIRLHLTLTNQRSPLWLTSLLILSLSTDFLFLRSARVSRPEIFVLFFVVFSLVLSTIQSPKLNSKTQHLLAGFIFSLAILTHPISILFLPSILIAWFHKSNFQNQLLLPSFLTGLGLPILLWLVWIFPHAKLAFTQLLLASQRKTLETTWFWLFNQSQTTILILIFVLVQLVSFTLFLKAIFNYPKISKPVLLTLSLLFASWLIAWTGRMSWYTAYITPFLYLALSTQIHKFTRHKIIHLLTLFWIIIISGNLYYLYKQVHQFGYHNPNFYQNYSTDILAQIPNHSTVLLSAIPDPYHYLTNNQTLTLYEFPVLPLSAESYQNMLDQVDYIVYNGIYNQVVAGNLLELYLKHNTQQLLSTSPTNKGFSAHIAHLVPKKERISVVNNPNLNYPHN